MKTGVNIFKCLSAGILLLTILSSGISAQDQHISFFSIKTENDTVDFIRISADTMKKKPVLIYLQGSLPVPLIIVEDGIQYIDNINRVYHRICEDFHVIMISHPHTPIIAQIDDLADMEYVPDKEKPNTYDPRYLKKYNLPHLLWRATEVIGFLKRETWVDHTRINLIGISQGAALAAAIAIEHPELYSIGYLSGNPEGRFTERIRKERMDALEGRQSMKQAQDNINSLYEKWKQICATDYERQDYSNLKGDPAEAWTSFSRPYIMDMCRIEPPLYIAYGTADPGTQACDILPVYFELYGKSNYKLVPYVDRGHSFEKKINSSSDFNDYILDEVILEYVNWVINMDR